MIADSWLGRMHPGGMDSCREVVVVVVGIVTGWWSRAWNLLQGSFAS